MRHGMVHMKPILIALLSPGGSGAMPVVAGTAGMYWKQSCPNRSPENLLHTFQSFSRRNYEL